MPVMRNAALGAARAPDQANRDAQGETLPIGSGNTHRRCRTRRSPSLEAEAEADPRRSNCRSHLGRHGNRRGALANLDLPCGGPSRHRVPSYSCRSDRLASRDRLDGLHPDHGPPHEIAAIAVGCALAAGEPSWSGCFSYLVDRVRGAPGFSCSLTNSDSPELRVMMPLSASILHLLLARSCRLLRRGRALQRGRRSSTGKLTAKQDADKPAAARSRKRA